MCVVRNSIHDADILLPGRVVDYALVVNNGSFIVLSNISFHAATVSIAGDVSDIYLLSLVFNYSAVSNRSLGNIVGTCLCL